MPVYPPSGPGGFLSGMVIDRQSGQNIRAWVFLGLASALIGTFLLVADQRIRIYFLFRRREGGSGGEEEGESEVEESREATLNDRLSVNGLH